MVVGSCSRHLDGGDGSPRRSTAPGASGADAACPLCAHSYRAARALGTGAKCPGADTLGPGPLAFCERTVGHGSLGVDALDRHVRRLGAIGLDAERLDAQGLDAERRWGRQHRQHRQRRQHAGGERRVVLGVDRNVGRRQWRQWGGSGGSGGAGAAGSTPGGSASPGGGATGSESQNAQDHSPRAQARRRAARVQRRERALRRDVERLQGCLASVPRSERRVLALRAGVGRARPHSRTEVARITHLKRKRVVTLERRGLRRLRALARAGVCGGAGGSSTAAAMPPGTGTALPPGGGPSGDRGAVRAEHHSSAPSKDGAGGEAEGERKRPTAELSISRPLPPGGDSFDLALVLAPLAVLAFLLVITREIRRAG